MARSRLLHFIGPEPCAHRPQPEQAEQAEQEPQRDPQRDPQRAGRKRHDDMPRERTEAEREAGADRKPGASGQRDDQAERDRQRETSRESVAGTHVYTAPFGPPGGRAASGVRASGVRAKAGGRRVCVSRRDAGAGRQLAGGWQVADRWLAGGWQVAGRWLAGGWQVVGRW